MRAMARSEGYPGGAGFLDRMGKCLNIEYVHSPFKTLDRPFITIQREAEQKPMDKQTVLSFDKPACIRADLSGTLMHAIPDIGSNQFQGFYAKRHR